MDSLCNKYLTQEVREVLLPITLKSTFTHALKGLPVRMVDTFVAVLL